MVVPRIEDGRSHPANGGATRPYGVVRDSRNARYFSKTWTSIRSRPSFDGAGRSTTSCGTPGVAATAPGVRLGPTGVALGATKVSGRTGAPENCGSESEGAAAGSAATTDRAARPRNPSTASARFIRFII